MRILILIYLLSDRMFEFHDFFAFLIKIGLPLHGPLLLQLFLFDIHFFVSYFLNHSALFILKFLLKLFLISDSHFFELLRLFRSILNFPLRSIHFTLKESYPITQKGAVATYLMVYLFYLTV